MLCEQCLCCNRRSLTLAEHTAVSVPGSLTVNVQSVQSCAHTSGQNRYGHQQQKNRSYAPHYTSQRCCPGAQPMRCMQLLLECHSGPPPFDDLTVSHCVSTSRCTDSMSPLLTPYLHHAHVYTHKSCVSTRIMYQHTSNTRNKYPRRDQLCKKHTRIGCLTTHMYHSIAMSCKPLLC